MGGVGSGRRSDREPRRLVERAFVLDIIDVTGGPLRPGRSGDLTLWAPLVVWPVYARFLIRRVDSIVATVWFDLPIGGAVAHLAIDGPVRGSHRRYFVCPRPNHPARVSPRAARLYWPVLDPSGFACRSCHNLAYRSQQARREEPRWMSRLRLAAGQ